MKTTLIKSAFAMALSALLFTSCEKAENTAPATAPVSERKMSMKELIAHPQFITAYKQMQDAYVAAHPNSRVEFIAPFFTADGFGLAQNIEIDWSGPFPVLTAGQFASFFTALDGNDFYRQNNDGTVSVHITSNRAYAEHFDIASLVAKYDESGHITMNYTGPVVSFDITDEFGNVIFTINFIDIGANPNAISFHGNGQVRENGSGPAQNLVGRWVCSPGWTQTNIGFTLN